MNMKKSSKKTEPEELVYDLVVNTKEEALHYCIEQEL
jgi:hypothetical protein